MAQTVALDIGGTSVKIGLVGEDWLVTRRTGLETDRGASFEAFAKQLEQAVREVAPEGVELNGISAPGAHDVHGVVVAGGDNVPFLTTGSLPEALAGTFGAHVLMENDGICAAAAELLLGAGRGRDRFVLATLGTGVGGAVVLGGRILAGRQAIPPEFGQLWLQPRQGDRPGKLESFGSATALRRLYRERRPDTPPDISPGRVLDLARGGDAAAGAAVDEMADRLGQAFGFMVNVLDLEAVVIGGGLSQSGTWLTGRIAEALGRYVHRFAERGIAVLPAEGGNDSGMLGAVAFARGLMRGRVQRAETWPAEKSEDTMSSPG